MIRNKPKNFLNIILFFCLVVKPIGSFAEPLFNGEKVDALHTEVTDRVSRTAKWLDAFFIDSVYDDEQNESRIKLRFDLLAEKGEAIDFGIRTSIRVRLPGTQKKMNFFISGIRDDDNPGDTDRDTQKNNDPEIGINYFFKNEWLNSVSVGAGVKRRDGTYGLYIKPRYRKTWDMATWNSRYTQTVSYHTSAGFETESRLDFERIISAKYFFRFTTQLDWYEVDPGVFYNFNFLLRQSIDRNRVLSYEWNNYFETKPEQVLDVSVLRVKYRQRFWKEWMFYEIAPELAFPNDKDHKLTPAIFLRLEMVFGYGDFDL